MNSALYLKGYFSSTDLRKIADDIEREDRRIKSKEEKSCLVQEMVSNCQKLGHPYFINIKEVPRCFCGEKIDNGNWLTSPGIQITIRRKIMELILIYCNDCGEESYIKVYINNFVDNEYCPLCQSPDIVEISSSQK